MHSPAMRKSRPSWPSVALSQPLVRVKGLVGTTLLQPGPRDTPRLVRGCLGGTHCAEMVVEMPRTQVMERYMSQGCGEQEQCSQGAKLRNVEQALHNAVCKLSEGFSGKDSRWHEKAMRN
ncbi:unnamed protein product [Pipistrellus nathusii]|uniref:Uncharacterized protein n=1 Tax=Pipistrellus nathusii TaxID=59473 RepID=A0ABN9Z3K1_PIPNA